MALKSNESPGVTIKEFDLSGTVPSVTSTTGAFVGDFAWGPVGTPVFVANESELVSKFGSPKDGGSSSDFLAVSQFLKYSGSAFVVRVGTGTPATFGPFTAKNIGKNGDNIKVVVSETENPVVGNEDDFDGVDVEVYYGDSLVESFPYLSSLEGSTNTGEGQSGDTNYFVEVINRKSQWITVDPEVSGLAAGDYELTGSSTPTASENDKDLAAAAAFSDVDQIQIDFICAHNIKEDTAIEIAQGRKDCVAIASPPTAPASADDVVKWAEGTPAVAAVPADDEGNGGSPAVPAIPGVPSSSYLVLDGNWVQVYNKYMDRYEMIPACSSTAGIMAATDLEAAPWFSPAGTRRGQYFGVSALAFNPTKGERDMMYKARVNPIVSMPGQGTVLFGDKTALARPSAFDRINVRRLFLVIERAIGEAAKNVMFELNDDFTRAEFTNIVEPFLREVQGRRGITDFRVVCDETNNTAEVIDRNEFVASCFIKPARSINYVTLNFVAVRTGVEFEEVVGQI
jgi:phage tail sheath protein FI